MVVKTVLVHFILVGIGEFTTHFRLPFFSGWIESDVHWGYDLAFDLMATCARARGMKF